MKAGPPPRGAAVRVVRGVLLVLAFVPVGWFLSAAVFGDDGDGRAVRGDGRDGSAGAVRFRTRDVLTGLDEHSSLAAHVKGDRVRVYRKPKEREGRTWLQARELDGQRLPLVMLVERRSADWVKVQLPTRPNGSTGWVREDDVALKQTDWHLKIDLSAFRVYTYRGARLVSTHTIGVGQAVTPTPHGLYYLTDLVQPDDPDGLYGAYAFGLSAHSDVITSFGTGDGQIGIHGTNDTSTLETNVSHGCIRVGNSVIESFARHFPLGTPVRIVS